MALVAGKLHHEYYWLPLAPVAAVAAARAIERLIRGGRVGGRRSADSGARRPGWVSGAVDVGDSARVGGCGGGRPHGGARSCHRGPGWRLPKRSCSRPTAEAAAWNGRPHAARRAAGEWGGRSHVETPIDLIDHYRSRGARYFADFGAGTAGSPRKGLHDAVRRRYKVIVDSPEVFIADLSDSGTYWNAN